MDSNEIDGAAVHPDSMRKLQDLRARHPEPLTELDRKEEIRLGREWGHPVRLVRHGVNTTIVCLTTVPFILKRMCWHAESGQIDNVRYFAQKYHTFIEEHGDHEEKERFANLIHHHL